MMVVNGMRTGLDQKALYRFVLARTKLKYNRTARAQPAADIAQQRGVALPRDMVKSIVGNHRIEAVRFELQGCHV